MHASYGADGWICGRVTMEPFAGAMRPKEEVAREHPGGAPRGQAEMLDPSSRGIRGNSHMIMQDMNNLQIADFILKWIVERVGKRGEKK